MRQRHRHHHAAAIGTACYVLYGSRTYLYERGALYAHAEREGFTKIALGHHRDDMVETLFLNLFHHSRISAMPPKLRSDDGRHVVIRPLAYCGEADIAEYAEARAFPDHPVQPVRLAGDAAAQADQGDAGGVGPPHAGPRRQRVPRARRRAARAPRRSHAVRFRRAGRARGCRAAFGSPTGCWARAAHPTPGDAPRPGRARPRPEAPFASVRLRTAINSPATRTDGPFDVLSQCHAVPVPQVRRGLVDEAWPSA